MVRVLCGPVLLALDLEVDCVVIPPYAGTFSAWGLLGADPTSTRARTRIMALNDEGLKEANNIAQTLFADLQEQHDKQTDSGLPLKREVAVDLRFLGQEHSLTVTVPSENGVITASVDKVLELFGNKYREAFGGVLEVPAQIVSVRSTLMQPLPSRTDAADGQTGTPPPRTNCQAYSFTRDEYMEFAVVALRDIAVGETIQGPAIINELTSTIYVDAEFTAEMDPSGSLFLRKV